VNASAARGAGSLAVFLAWTAVAAGASAPPADAAPAARGAPAESASTERAEAPPATGTQFDTTGTTEGLPIRRVEIHARNIYDPLPTGRLRPVYRLANTLHVRTRQSTIRHLLLFEPGDRWQDARGRETARLLRELDILEPYRLSATRQRDSVDVWVETRDAWSTQPEFVFESGGGQLTGAISFVERNLLGLGKSISLSYREDATSVSRSASYYDPSVLGTRLRLEGGGSTSSDGASQQFASGVPFYAQEAPYSFGLRWQRATSVARLFQDGTEVADFDRRLEEVEVYGGRGRRIRGGAVLRLTGSFLFHDRRFGPSRLDGKAPPAFAGGEEKLRLRRLAGTMRLWSPRYVEKTGVERLDGIEDFDLGQSLSLTLGFAPELLGSSDDQGYAEARIELGVKSDPRSFGVTRMRAATRLERRPIESIGHLDARWVSQHLPGQTFVVAAEGMAGREVARDFQAIAGGLNGLRAYPVQALAGTQLWRFNAEHRWVLGREYYALFSLGAAVFYDLARAWGPGSAAAPWHHDAGFGVRLSLPRSGRNRVARFDVAWPISPQRDGRRDPVFSFGSSQAF
jgi:surface antigen Omp85-like protein